MNSKIVCLLVAFAVSSSEAAKLNNAYLARYLCRSRPDGFKTIVPGSCSKYYECIDGKTHIVTCDHFYDSVKQECVNKNPGCVETNVRQPDCQGPCCGIENGGYAVDPKEPEIYYLCENKKVSKEKKCESGKMFDLITQKCSQPSTCLGCVTPKPPCKITTTTCSTTTTTCTTTTCKPTTTTCSTTTTSAPC
ncbi:uncharacterized protein ACRADG_004339 isoform 2-T2 [Cochliomyia hominivorax]